jgi:anti-sigma factor RsiW
MKVTRDVVKDLLTLYLAGEASPDTRVVVEEWLRTDPELARQAEQARRLDLPAVPALPPTVEKRALDRTRRHLRWRSVLLGFTIYVTALPLSITFNRAGYNGLLIDNWPERFAVGALAIVLWIVYWRMSRAVRPSRS